MAETCKKLFLLVPDVEIHNLYGPTEASVGVSHFQATIESLGTSTVAAIGKPFSYVNFRVFDPSKYEDKQITSELLQDVPDGETGELFIGGDCLAHGYINDEHKTNTAFFNLPTIQSKPTTSASPFTLYKTGDLVRKLENGGFEYLGRCDFQVKIGGVRIECEEVSSVLLKHRAVNDALVTAFDGPYGKALAAYVVVNPDFDWDAAEPDAVGAEEDSEDDDTEDLVSKWGAIYDEMYQDSGDGVSQTDPTLNWSGYTDTYSRKTHAQPVIQEWVEWSCEQVLRYKHLFNNESEMQIPRCVVELGCGNGMLLFRIAPSVVASSPESKYIGTDISTTALKYIDKIMATDKTYQHMAIDTKQIAAHEVLNVCKPRSNDVVLCNGVTMYFPSATYLVDCMKTAVDATKDGGYAIFGDIQSKRHVIYFHSEVQTYQALRRHDSTPGSVLRAARQAAATEGLSYFDDDLFHHLDHQSSKLFDGRVARVEMRLKRGWWHSEFNRFRYDIELVVDPKCQSVNEQLSFQHRSYGQVCAALGLDTNTDQVSVPVCALAKWINAELAKLPESHSGVVVTLPNARTLRSVRLHAWLEAASRDGRSLAELPDWLIPTDKELGGMDTSANKLYGVEPEALFELELPKGWTQRVIWSQDPAMLEFILLRDDVANLPWLRAVQMKKSHLNLSGEVLDAFKNNGADFAENEALDPATACHKALKAWTSQTSLLPAMRPMVFVAVDEFPKNQAGKTDRGKLPDARQVLENLSDAATLEFEAPETEDEKKMAQIWQDVVKVPVSVTAPFLTYGGNSLTALQLASRVAEAFGSRPDFAFLTSEECTVRELLRKVQSGGEALKNKDDVGCVLKLSQAKNTNEMPLLLIFGAAGTSAATYQPLAEHLQDMQVYCVEMPGRGQRIDEPLENEFDSLLAKILPDVRRCANKAERFLLWGDSLGAVLAYEAAKSLQADSEGELLSLIVSGNAGPTVAALEQGMGSNTTDSLGRECLSVKDMSLQDWKTFFIASSGKDKTKELETLLADESLAEQALRPLIADCEAYESYNSCDGTRITSPIITIRGDQDCITSSSVMKSWEDVAAGRIEHIQVAGSGHMLVRDAPKELARHIAKVSIDVAEISQHKDAIRA